VLSNGKRSTTMAVEDDVERPAQVDIPAPPQIRTRRNPRWIALGVIAICLGAISSFLLYSQLAESHQVIAVRETIHRGSTITQADLTTIRVGNTDRVATVPADRLPEMVGKVAAFDLVGGALLPPEAVTDELPPAADQAIVGVRLATGRAPSGFLPPGSPIRLVVLPDPDAVGDPAEADDPTGSQGDAGVTESADPTPVIDGTVINTVQLDDGVVINVQVTAAQAVGAASYAAQDRIAVVRDSER
jgi:hypothetical protein